MPPAATAHGESCVAFGRRAMDLHAPYGTVLTGGRIRGPSRMPGRFGRRARSSRPGRANGQSPSAALRPCAPAVRTPAVRVVHANPGHLASSRGEPRLASPARAPAATALPVGPETCSAGPERRGRCAPRRRAGRPPAAVRLAVGVAGTRSPSEAASWLWNGAERARSGGSCRRSPARADETDAYEALASPQDARAPPIFVFPPVCMYLGRSPPLPHPRRCSRPFPRRILPRPVPAARTTPAGPPARTRPHTRPHAPRSTRSPPALPRDPPAVLQAPLHARDSSALGAHGPHAPAGCCPRSGAPACGSGRAGGHWGWRWP